MLDLYYTYKNFSYPWACWTTGRRNYNILTPGVAEMKSFLTCFLFSTKYGTLLFAWKVSKLADLVLNSLTIRFQVQHVVFFVSLEVLFCVCLWKGGRQFLLQTRKDQTNWSLLLGFNMVSQFLSSWNASCIEWHFVTSLFQLQPNVVVRM